MIKVYYYSFAGATRERKKVTISVTEPRGTCWTEMIHLFWVDKLQSAWGNVPCLARVGWSSGAVAYIETSSQKNKQKKKSSCLKEVFVWDQKTSCPALQNTTVRLVLKIQQRRAHKPVKVKCVIWPLGSLFGLSALDHCRKLAVQHGRLHGRAPVLSVHMKGLF